MVNNNYKNRYKKFKKRNFTRINHQIKAHTVLLVVDKETQKIPLQEALSKAKKLELDLVEIAQNNNIPVVKIVDYGKYKFEKSKREKENKKRSQTMQIKEVKMGPKIDVGDFDRKCKDILGFINSGDQVKVTMRFKGREIIHTELGEEKMLAIQEKIQDSIKIEKPLKMEGRIMSMTLSKAKK